MASKPRKQFDGIARPQGFIDDAALALLKAAGRVKNAGKKGEASLLSPMSKKKFEKIYGPPPVKSKRMSADQKVASRQRDENIRANINRVEGAPRINSNSRKRRPVRGY